MDKTALTEQLKVVLASAFSLYLKAHNYHWNVTGPNFIQNHDFFGKVYTDVHASIDVYAEHIRALSAFAPGSLIRFSELTRIADEVAVPNSKFMFIRLASDNQTLLNELRSTAALADELSERGIVNFIEGQIDAHEKLQWMLTSFVEA